MADLEKSMVSADHVDSVEQTEQVQLYNETGRIRKIPIPSADPNDPLNFSPWKQRLILISICVYGFVGFGVVQSTGLFFPKLIADYKAQTRGQFDPARISDLASFPSLCMGLGNFLFVPLSMVLGRRFAVLLSNALLIASLIWGAKSTSFESHLAARCLQGLTAGIADCLLPIIVLDISFIHKRSARLVTYWTVTALGSSLLLVAVPFAVDAAGENWQINYWFWTAFAGFSFVLFIFALPETLFNRPAISLSGRILATDAYGTVRTFASAEEARQRGFDVAEEVDTISDSEQTPTNESYVKQFSPISLQSNKPIQRFFLAYRDIFLCILTPGTLWALLLNSVMYGGLVIFSLTYSQRLQMPPWSFSASTVGTVQVGSAIGALVALVLVGFTSEPISEFLTRRNGGVREPVFLLPSFLLPCLLLFSGLLLYGVVGATPAEHSWVGIHAAFALFYCGFCAVSALTGVWIAELLPSWSGPAMVLTCGGRNAISFGISYSFASWLAHMGFARTHILLGGIVLILAAFAIPLYFTNKYIQRVVSKSIWKE